MTAANWERHPLPSILPLAPSQPGTCWGTFCLSSPTDGPAQPRPSTSTHLEVLLIQDLFPPLDQESCTHVQVEVGEPLWLRLGRQRTELGRQALTRSGASPLGPSPPARWERSAAPLSWLGKRGLKRLSRGPACEAQADTKQEGVGTPAQLYCTPGRRGRPGTVWRGGRASLHTWYVSHRRMVQRRGSSRISRLFIQRKANCRYSTSYRLK